MIQSSAFDPAIALVPPGTPTFADLIARLPSAEVVSAPRRRDMASGLRCVAEALGRPPEAVPALPTWLQPRLERIAPASLGMSPKTWSNLLSNARAAFALFGCVGRRIHRKDDLSPEWRVLWEAVLASGNRTLRPSLGRFVYYLNSQGVAPSDVTDTQAATYHEALSADELRKSPDNVFKSALHAWNMAVRTIEGWPDRPLSIPATGRRIKLPLDSFPESFRVDLETFRETLLHPDALDPDALDAPRSVTTADQYERQLHRFASILVHAGIPILEIDGLAALVAPKRAELGLRRMLDRNGGHTSRGIDQIATILKLVGRRFIRVSEAEQKALNRLAQRLGFRRQPGMTTKNRDRLRSLQDPATLRCLLDLPHELFTRAETHADTQAAALEREDGLALAILLIAPIRRKNLSTIHLDRNLQRAGDAMYLVFPPDEVKNGQPIEFELLPAIASMIDRHLATRSPKLCPSHTPWLFPRRDGTTSMHPDGLSKRIRTRLRRELGLDINPHLFRHLSAKLLLDAHPGAYEAVRHLLGHARLSSTLNAYIGLETATAARLFADAVEAVRRG